MLQLANTNTNKPNGTKPNQEIEKDFTKNRVPNPFSKIPQFKKNLEIFYIFEGNKEKRLYRHTLDMI